MPRDEALRYSTPRERLNPSAFLDLITKAPLPPRALNISLFYQGVLPLGRSSEDLIRYINDCLAVGALPFLRQRYVSSITGEWVSSLSPEAFRINLPRRDEVLKLKNSKQYKPPLVEMAYGLFATMPPNLARKRQIAAYRNLVGSGNKLDEITKAGYNLFEGKLVLVTLGRKEETVVSFNTLHEPFINARVGIHTQGLLAENPDLKTRFDRWFEHLGLEKVA